MKNVKKILTIGIIGLFLSTSTFAQSKVNVAVLNVYGQGVLLDSDQLSNLLRLELEKTNVYNILDRYDMIDIIEKHNVKVSGCYGKTCLVDIGKVLKVNKILTGSIERYGEKIVITLRMVNVEASDVEQTGVYEYINIQPELQKMIEISVKKFFGVATDQEVENKLVKKFTYESATTNPGATKVILNGPRMGVSYITGQKGERLQDPLKSGGFDAWPVLTQFGYQHEVQYLNEGNFQAMVEFIPMISGIDQGMLMPSFTLLNGLRNNLYGWEIAFGPNLGIAKRAKGYYDGEGEWHLKNEWNEKDSNGFLVPNPYDIVERYDKRGFATIATGFVWAIGKTFKSGHLNIPVNAYIAPNKDGCFVGLTFGFNSKNRVK